MSEYNVQRARSKFLAFVAGHGDYESLIGMFEVPMAAP